MFEFIINTLKEISIFVGYIKNNTYPTPLNEKEEEYFNARKKNEQENFY